MLPVTVVPLCGSVSLLSGTSLLVCFSASTLSWVVCGIEWLVGHLSLYWIQLSQSSPNLICCPPVPAIKVAVSFKDTISQHSTPSLQSRI